MAIRKPGRVSRRLPPQFPRAVERAMTRIALRYVRLMQREIGRRVIRAMKGRMDVEIAAEVSKIQLLAFTARALTEIPEGMRITPSMLDRYGRLVYRHAEGETTRLIERPTLLAVDPANGHERAIRAWAEEAASRIVIIEEDYRDRVRRVIEEGYEQGKVAESIARDIQRLGAASENRARLWARDQVATLNAQATEDAHARVGVTHYEWSTSRDERVRDGDKPGDNHVEREGWIYAWDRPPAENAIDGHPGQPINCRCVALPVDPAELTERLEAQRDRANPPPYTAD